MQITPFSPDDIDEVVEVWNRTASGRALYYPLTVEKVRQLFLDKPSFDPRGFLLVRDERRIAGGILVSAETAAATSGVATLFGIFDRNGHPGVYAQAALDAALDYVASRGCTVLQTGGIAAVNAHDLPMLEFLCSNRFFNPSVYDCVIEQQIADSFLLVTRELESFRVPEEIVAIETVLRERGYACRFVHGDESLIQHVLDSEMPFKGTFANSLRSNSPREELMLAFSPAETPVGGRADLSPWCANGLAGIWLRLCTLRSHRRVARAPRRCRESPPLPHAGTRAGMGVSHHHYPNCRLDFPVLSQGRRAYQERHAGNEAPDREAHAEHSLKISFTWPVLFITISNNALLARHSLSIMNNPG